MCNKKVYKIYIMLLLYLKLKVKAFTLISSVFLDRVKEAFQKDAQLKSLLMDDYFCKKLAESHSSWRRAITTAINYGVPVPAFSSALAYYDGYRCPRLPANLLQVLN